MRHKLKNSLIILNSSYACLSYSNKSNNFYFIPYFFAIVPFAISVERWKWKQNQSQVKSVSSYVVFSNNDIDIKRESCKNINKIEVTSDSKINSL